MYSQDEMADMDFTMFTLISSQTAGGFKIDATSNNINDYMDNFEREVTVDTLSFTKDRTTGRIKDGSMTITFYMKSESEAT